MNAAVEVTELAKVIGDKIIVDRISITVGEGEVFGLLGHNGSGKTTTFNMLSGLLSPSSGSVTILGKNMKELQKARPEIGFVTQEYSFYETLTVKENLDFCLEAFPRLRERSGQLAGSLSGGEQQMLALGRALMLAPRILLVDEPSVGLAPILVQRTIDKIRELRDSYKLTVLMAEQNFTQAIRIADRGYVIVHGRIAFEGRSADELNNNDLIRKFYLGL